MKRFWKHVQKGRGCWLWKASTNGTYGQFWVVNHKVKTSAHRFSYQLAHGEIPAGMHVLHKCDNPICVNPRHLFLGTQKDNNRDCVNKGRHWSPFKEPALHRKAIEKSIQTRRRNHE